MRKYKIKERKKGVFMTGEILKNNEKFVRKENTKKENTKNEGGKTRRPYNRKKKEFNGEAKEMKITQEKFIQIFADVVLNYKIKYLKWQNSSVEQSMVLTGWIKR